MILHFSICHMSMIALIEGGQGAEREISFMSSRAVGQALKKLGFSFKTFELNRQLSARLLREKPSKAFLAVHGQYAEDGILQALLESLKIPYTGSGVLPSSVCMDKVFFKSLLKHLKIPTPAWKSLPTTMSKKQNVKNMSLRNFEEQYSQILSTIPFPLVVKPNRQGSSVGVKLCQNRKELRLSLREALKWDSVVLVEPYIEGMEVAFSYLNGKILTPVQIAPLSGFYDYKSKYTSGMTEYIVPAPLSKKTSNLCKKYLKLLVGKLGISTYCRADFIISRNRMYLLELNTLPGLTNHSLLPKSALYDGISFEELIQMILDGANLDYA